MLRTRPSMAVASGLGLVLLMLSGIAPIHSARPAQMFAADGGGDHLAHPAYLAARRKLAQTASTSFTVDGLLQYATVSGTDPFAGGTLTVANKRVIVPKNTIVILPGSFGSWGQLFGDLAPAACKDTGMTGWGLNEGPCTGATPSYGPIAVTVHVDGNRVGNDLVAGLIYIGAPYIDSGFITAITYVTNSDGAVTPVLSVDSSSNAGVSQIRINDIGGKYLSGIPNSEDPRLTADQGNPTIRTETAYPMCIQPGAAGGPYKDDSKCPDANRVTIAAGQPQQWTITPNSGDATAPVPLKKGDMITYSGFMYCPTATSVATDTTVTSGCYISAFSIVASISLLTSARGLPGDATYPVYLATDVALMGTGGTTVAGVTEATARTRFEGFCTRYNYLPVEDCVQPANVGGGGQKAVGDASGCTLVDIYALDIDPCTGALQERYFGATDVDVGAPTGAVLGRWRFRPDKAYDVVTPFAPPPMQVRAKIRPRGWAAKVEAAGQPWGDIVTPADYNNVDAGATSAPGWTPFVYDSPIAEFLFPEGVPGVFVPYNFDVFGHLAQGSANALVAPQPPTTGAAAVFVGQLAPWPGASAPQQQSCSGGGGTAGPSVANTGQPKVRSIQYGNAIKLDGSASTITANTKSAEWSYQTNDGTVTITPDATTKPPGLKATAQVSGAGAYSFTLTLTDKDDTFSTDSILENVVPQKDVILTLAVKYKISKARLDITATSSTPAAATLTTVWQNSVGGTPNPVVMTPVAGVPTVSIVGTIYPSRVDIYSTRGGTLGTDVPPACIGAKGKPKVCKTALWTVVK